MLDLRAFRPLPFVRRGVLLAALELHREGIAYVWGGKSPEATNTHGWAPGGLDCSGFCTHLFWQLSGGKVDVRATHNAELLRQQLTPSFGYMAEPGDLVFYGTESHASHVMLSLGAGLVVGQAWGDETCHDPAASRGRGFVTKVLPILYRRDCIGRGIPAYAPEPP